MNIIRLSLLLIFTSLFLPSVKAANIPSYILKSLNGTGGSFICSNSKLAASLYIFEGLQISKTGTAKFKSAKRTDFATGIKGIKPGKQVSVNIEGNKLNYNLSKTQREYTNSSKTNYNIYQVLYFSGTLSDGCIFKGAVTATREYKSEKLVDSWAHTDFIANYKGKLCYSLTSE